MFAAVWGSPMVADGKIYLGDEDGDVVIMQPGKTLKVIGEMNMGSSVYATPIAVNGTLFIANRNQLLRARLRRQAVERRREVALGGLKLGPLLTRSAGPAEAPAFRPAVTPAARGALRRATAGRPASAARTRSRSRTRLDRERTRTARQERIRPDS